MTLFQVAFILAWSLLVLKLYRTYRALPIIKRKELKEAIGGEDTRHFYPAVMCALCWAVAVIAFIHLINQDPEKKFQPLLEGVYTVWALIFGEQSDLIILPFFNGIFFILLGIVLLLAMRLSLTLVIYQQFIMRHGKYCTMANASKGKRAAARSVRTFTKGSFFRTLLVLPFLFFAVFTEPLWLSFSDTGLTFPIASEESGNLSFITVPWQELSPIKVSFLLESPTSRDADTDELEEAIPVLKLSIKVPSPEGFDGNGEYVELGEDSSLGLMFKHTFEFLRLAAQGGAAIKYIEPSQEFLGVLSISNNMHTLAIRNVIEPKLSDSFRRRVEKLD